MADVCGLDILLLTCQTITKLYSDRSWCEKNIIRQCNGSLTVYILEPCCLFCLSDFHFSLATQSNILKKITGRNWSTGLEFTMPNLKGAAKRIHAYTQPVPFSSCENPIQEHKDNTPLQLRPFVAWLLTRHKAVFPEVSIQ